MIGNERRVESCVSPRDRLQIIERVKRERLPLFVVRDNEKNREIASWRKIPGTEVRVSPEGDIAYPVWRERSWLNKPELYIPCQKLPPGWNFERLLASQRRPISEITYYQVRADDGAVEAAIRSVDHVIDDYKDKGRELQQIEGVRRQIDQARRILQETKGVRPEEFEDGFTALYHETIELMERLGMRQASSSLKRDIERLLEEVSTGRDRLGRRNPIALLKKLEAAAKRVEYRWQETNCIVGKFSAMREGLVVRRAKDREIIEKAKHELGEGFANHAYFIRNISTRDISPQQVGILQGKIGTLIFQLELTWVKGYKPAAEEIMGKLEQAQNAIRMRKFQGAKELFNQSLAIATSTLNQFPDGITELS